MDIGAKIRAIRKNKGLTQIEVADKAQIAVNSLRNYEANKRQPNMDQLRAIADALGVSLSDLIWQGEGPAPEPLCGVVTPHGSYLSFDDTLRRTAQNILDGMHLEQRSQALLAAFDQLNPDGQQKAVERVEELTEIPKYKK